MADGRASRELPRGMSGERRSSQTRPSVSTNAAAARGRFGQQNAPRPGHSSTGCSSAGPGRHLPSVQYKRPPNGSVSLIQKRNISIRGDTSRSNKIIGIGPDFRAMKIQRPSPPSILRRRQNQHQQPRRQQQQGRPPPRRTCRFADEARGLPLATLYLTRPMTKPEDVSRLYYTEEDFDEFQRQADLEAENGSAVAAAVAAAGAPTAAARRVRMNLRFSAQAGAVGRRTDPRSSPPPPPQNAVANGRHRAPLGVTVGQGRTRMDAYKRACHAYSAIDASRSRCR